ncbi:MAG: SapC family protein [Beijerinckiaceae bacterium]|nr:SapC family protein [Beijerinckiaceae bacterium]
MSADVVTALPLFYRSIEPLNRDVHRGYGLAMEAPYAFARSSHLLPAVVDEFPVACAELPIVFIQEADGSAPVFLTGVKPGENVFVAGDGTWTGRYVPAYLRRFPFILGEVPGGEPLICLDSEAGIVRKHAEPGRDHLLFTVDGGESPELTGRIRLVADYAQAATRTQAFTALLRDHKLLQPITVQTNRNGAGNAIHGLLAVDENALNALSDEAFLTLRAANALSAIYMHLVSLRSIERLGMP